MPRRRMLDPSFFDDTDIAKLSRDERLFLLGCIRNADDDGRLNGHPAYLKAEIFMYDDDIDLEKIRQIKDSSLEKMETWQQDNLWQLVPYQNADHDYLYFPKWSQQQKPSHPTPSKLPEPPQLPNSSRVTPEPVQSNTGVTPSQSSLGQSSLVKDSIVQSSGVQEDFTKFLDSEKDLTDFLTQTLTKYMPRGPTWEVEVLNRLWKQALGEPMKQAVFALTLEAAKKYPPAVLARAYTKAVKYHGGKYGSWKYLDKILKEQMEKEKPP